MSLMVSRQRRWNMLDYYHGVLDAEFVLDHLKENGDYLIRKSKDDNWMISVKWQNNIYHCEPKYRDDLYNFGSHEFRHINDLVYFHWHKQIPLQTVESQPLLSRPIPCTRKTYKITDLEVISKIGEGNFGEVYKVKIIPTGQLAAMKTLKSVVTKEVRESFLDEMNMVAPMKHENIVQCLGTVEDGDNVKILLELINKGNLVTLLRTGRLTDRGKARVLLHVAKGIQYLHRHSIIHRDLAARNILIQRNEDDTITAKVSDFGLSFKDDCGEGYKMTTCERLPVKWLAPECFTKNVWTTASDVWSFGILSWEVYNNGREPYSDQSFHDFHYLTKYIKQGGHPVDLTEIVPEMRKLILSCWIVDPDRRPSMDDVVYDIEKLYPTIK